MFQEDSPVNSYLDQNQFINNEVIFFYNCWLDELLQ